MNTRIVAEEIWLPIGDDGLAGELALPSGSDSLVLFAHGSGSSRLSPRNRMVADHLNHAGIGTLLFDLLTSSESRADQRTGEYRFDIRLLAQRLVSAIDWTRSRADTASLSLGLFGASTGAAAALLAASERPDSIRAVVSRGGRPDLVGEDLKRVHAPTLLVVGELDSEVIDLNRKALRQLPGVHRLEIVPGATHLFEEPGTLEKVIHHATGWFSQYL